jgi:protein-tyrosine phosphatase
VIIIDGRALDIDRVAPKLHQGGAVDPTYHYSWFDVIVLCATEYQPELPYFRGEIVRPAFHDTDTPTRLELARAAAAANLVANATRRGQRVLVSCFMGWNRSGLVTGIALGRTTSGEHALGLIRRARGDKALGNETFARIVRSTPMQYLGRGVSIRL